MYKGCKCILLLWGILLIKAGVRAQINLSLGLLLRRKQEVRVQVARIEEKKGKRGKIESFMAGNREQGGGGEVRFKTISYSLRSSSMHIASPEKEET